MSTGKYILDKKGNPVVVTDLMTWAAWFEESCRDFDKSKRRVTRTQVGPYTVSTVFLGLDHNYGKGPPILWETMVFRKKTPGPIWEREDGKELEMDRCSGSREQAEAMHQKMVELVKEKYGNRNKTKARKSTRP